MKSIILFFSVFALFFTCLANPPPVVVDQDITVKFVADDLSASIDGINQELNLEHQEYLQVTLPLAFDMPSSLIIALVVEISTLDVNYNCYTGNYLTQDVIVWNLRSIDDIQLYRSYDRLYLATNKNELLNMGPSRLNVGKNVSFSEVYTDVQKSIV